MHNHNNLADPDQFATPASFETALAMSDLFRVTLDIGHFAAGNNDPVAFISKHHDRIVNIHVRDRKRDNGPNRPFGQGDTPITEVLRLIRDNRYAIRAISSTNTARSGHRSRRRRRCSSTARTFWHESPACAPHHRPADRRTRRHAWRDGRRRTDDASSVMPAAIRRRPRRWSAVAPCTCSTTATSATAWI